MKKTLTLALALILGMGICQAQDLQGESAAGVRLMYGTEIESLGLGIDFQYCVIDHVRGEVSFNYFFEHNHTNWMDVNLNAHYLVSLMDHKMFLYPLVGLNYTMAKVKYDDTDFEKDDEGNYVLDDEGKPKSKNVTTSYEENHVGLNVGAGIEYKFNDHFSAGLEYRHTIIRKVDQGVFGVNLHYHF